MNAIDMPPDVAPTEQIHPHIASIAIKKKTTAEIQGNNQAND